MPAFRAPRLRGPSRRSAFPACPERGMPVKPKIEYSEGDPLPCDTCGITLENYRAWLQHFRYHQDEQFKGEGLNAEGKRMYTCAFSGCNRKMEQWGNIVTHINRHLSRRLHCCPEFIRVQDPSDPNVVALAQCPMKAPDNSQIFAHRRRHHGYVPERPWTYRPRKVEVDVQPQVTVPQVPTVPESSMAHSQDNLPGSSNTAALSAEVPSIQDILPVLDNQFDLDVLSLANSLFSDNSLLTWPSDYAPFSDPALTSFDWNTAPASFVAPMPIAPEDWPSFE